MPEPRKTDLALYLFEGCGYCEAVRRAIEDLGLRVEERDIRRDPGHLRALVEARGRRTVPVLRIPGADGAPDRWLGESQDIVAYLYERFGHGARPPLLLAPWVKLAMWGLLLGGGIADEPARSALWTAACSLAAVRSGWLATRTGAPIHAAVAGAFAFGAVSIALAAAGIADLPWWWVAIAVTAAAALAPLRRKRRSTAG